MKTSNSIHVDLTNHLRGFFAAPIISFLGRHGSMLSRKLTDKFGPQDFPDIPNKRALITVFRYLLAIGLFNSEGDDKFSLTRRGWEVMRRANSFFVPHSYAEYMFRLDSLLLGKIEEVDIKVDRLENVIGSGITHLRYFPPIVSHLKRVGKPEVLIDLGCGDGGFLKEVLKQCDVASIIGVDMSEVSTNATSTALTGMFPNVDVTTITCDASNVDVWAPAARNIAAERKTAISMWFLLHEISKLSHATLTAFLFSIHKHFPNSELIIGEVVRQADPILQKIAPHSLMPEYLFFHDLSMQGILRWKDYQKAVFDSPYKIDTEKLFDESTSDEGGSLEPSTFLWTLSPR